MSDWYYGGGIDRRYSDFPSGYDDWKTTDPRGDDDDQTEVDPDDYNDRDYDPTAPDEWR